MKNLLLSFEKLGTILNCHVDSFYHYRVVEFNQSACCLIYHQFFQISVTDTEEKFISVFTSAVLVSSTVEIFPSNGSCGRIHTVNIDFRLAVQKISATGQYFCTQDF